MPLLQLARLERAIGHHRNMGDYWLWQCVLPIAPQCVLDRSVTATRGGKHQSRAFIGFDLDAKV
jgi:hypothetical protein